MGAQLHNEQQQQQQESLSQLLYQTIENGTPLFNDGNRKECFELFLQTARHVLSMSSLSSIQSSVVGQQLELGVEEAKRCKRQQEWTKGAWVLRKTFDKVRHDPEAKQLLVVKQQQQQQQQQHTNSSSKNNDKTMTVSQLVKTTIQRGAPLYNEGKAKQYCDLYLETAIVVCESLPATLMDANDENNTSVPVAMLLLQQAIEQANEFQAREEWKDLAWALRVAFDAILLDDTIGGHWLNFNKRSPTKSVSSSQQPPQQESTTTTTTEAADKTLNNNRAAAYKKVIDVRDRSFRFKNYFECFVGSEAVTVLVQQKMASDRQDATARLEQLLQANLIHHVTREHSFQDGHFFYRFSSSQ